MEVIGKVVLDVCGKQYEISGGGGCIPGPNTVGTEQIIDGAVETEDLNEDVKDKMTHTYDAQNEGIKIGGFVANNASTAPTVPTQPMDVEEEEEP